jgi:hypothetical protein
VARRDWPIVVGGCHRSGTSVVRRVLDAHPRIHCGPEVLFFRDFYGDYVNDPFDRLRFPATARAVLPEGELLDLLGQAFISLHERAARHAGKNRWADKAPENVLYVKEWQRLLGEDWLLVHVGRNPLDTLGSMKESPFPLTLPGDLEGRIDYWTRFTEAGLEFGDEHPERYRRIIYEELCTSPATVVEGLMGWLGETFAPEQLRFNDVDHQSGQEDPKIGETSEIHAESLGRWPSLLSADEAVRIWSATRELWQRIDPDLRHVSPPEVATSSPATGSS